MINKNYPDEPTDVAKVDSSKYDAELIGDNDQALLGGQLSIYVKSKEKGHGILTLKMDSIVKKIEFEVK